VIALAIGAAGCTNQGDSSSLGSGTTPTPNPSTETFTGTLTQGGTDINHFTVSNSGYNLLAGFTAIGPANVTALGLGIGTWDGTNCGLNLTQNGTSTVGSTAITGTANSGMYCTRVYDGGNIPAGTTVTYTLQVNHY
jgi:hypothetical protein